MNENREITAGIANSSRFERSPQARGSYVQAKGCSPDGSTSSSKSLYDLKVANPHVAIVDFLENAITEKFKIFASLFIETRH